MHRKWLSMKGLREMQAGNKLLNVKSFDDIGHFETRSTHPDIPLARVPAWKRGTDLACLLVALPTLLPLMLGIAALIKFVSPGPIFFTQERIGFMGKRFRIFKFRTMRVNAETTSHQNHLKDLINSDVPMTKMDSKGDPRVIPLGAFLRSSGLDELPQLINVFRGEMSLVGPRPCTPYEYDQFQPWHKQRLRALPGLTGLWQVSGKNKTTFSEMINLDIQYANNWTIGLDFKIMMRTFPVLFGQVKEQKEQKIRKPRENS
jgi:lipopolysaccharide/colanic/teichoic acid biosynthesis glycosyltransferase